jgi:hypothetical protein
MDEPLLRLIRDAFPERPLTERPLTGHRCGECDEVDAVLADRTWPDVAGVFPSYCHDAFPLLTPAARAYYLPAYMVTALGPECGLQGTSLESALEDDQLDPAVFTPAQQATVLLWAESYWRCLGENGPPAAIAARWGLVTTSWHSEPDVAR